ncbi:replication initiation protein [Klebsiella pneumoniae]|nr:replication initiation protein [Escherichia coli]MCP5693721.1 replication initiation protein [Klebsiella pneumoniae]
MFWLGFDVDRVGAAIDWSDRNAPAPTLTITNPENGHAHLLYALQTSIRTAPDGKMKPLRYAAAVENALRKKLDADVGYSGLICKNPNHGYWKIAVWQPELYTLDWLADSLDLNAANDKEIVADYGLGRNCTLFDKTRKWAYRAIRQGWPEYDQWLKACYERASADNLQFSFPLEDKEVIGIARSIAKWTYVKLIKLSFDNYVERTHLSELQSARGKVGGRKSKRMKDPDSVESKKPWLSLGISRSTFYSRKRLGLL